jgi:hypothetical protein
VIRRAVHALAALLAIAALSSCGVTGRSDTVAKVGGTTLTTSGLAKLAGAEKSGDALRAAITEWITVGALGGDVGNVASKTDLDQLLTDAKTRIATPHLDAARKAYEQGLDAAGLCLLYIPVAAPTTSKEVLDALAGGMKFDEALQKYSSDATTVQSGGKMGGGCVGAATVESQLPGLIDALRKAGATVGNFVSVNYQGTDLVMGLRNFDDLSLDEKARFALADISPDVKKAIDSAKVYVNPRYGVWSPSAATVVALSTS